MAEPHLRLVDEDGVVHEPEPCEECARLQRDLRMTEDQLEGAEREVRAWRARYADAVRDAEREAKRHPLYKKAEELFEEWRVLCHHPRSQWTPDRFKAVQPFLKKDGYDKCLLAIKGAAFDPYTKARANGSIKRFDDWETIFGPKRGRFEEFVNRAPASALAEYKAKISAHAPDAAQSGPGAGDDRPEGDSATLW